MLNISIVNVFAEEKDSDSIVKTYDHIIEEINNVNKSIDDNDSLMKTMSESDTQKIDSLKEELENLIKDNPEQFENMITTDEEKMKELPVVEENSKTRMAYASANPWNNYGDIFVSRASVLTASLTGHAGLGEYNRGWTIESYPYSKTEEGVNVSSGVQRHNRYYDWKRDGSAGIYRPYNTSSGAFGRVLDYCRARIGEPYNFSFTSGGSGYYCSELVYFAWKNSEGINLRTNTSLGDNFIVPAELANSPRTQSVAWPY